MTKRTAEDYAALSRAVESGEYTVGGPLELGASLQMGRPAGGMKRGKTPNLSVRLPKAIRDELTVRAKAEGSTESELIRRAVVEYIGNHPAGCS
ncbi:hypothetical protein MHAE_11381 [Mycobacterium haemophilum DSM 44634]|uniref:ribbon-helix-helix domain-containing protein n=1 Tax=Mycobacterium haemophilum TaxID=29311 RepID=UPI0009E9B041|nr:CopG family transcriptional regulator [Mycobacterium haemophilum]MCV7342626.1 CopG family transcriptional regulator [Mycobacterium haemophilum DSM 44634]